jgi:4-hydroxybenzoate polyprenyltransferase
MFRKIADYFIFSSLFIAFCAVLMAHQANHLLQLDYDRKDYLLFVFFSTICSYNFHWYLTPESSTERIRVNWTHAHKKLHIILIIVGFIGAVYYALHFIQHWFWLGGAVFLTFLYSAPKLQFAFARFLRKIAIGKTIFLSVVWTYVTAILPVIFGGSGWRPEYILFCAARYFLIYAICIIFDYRDRETDRNEGIRSMVTYFDEAGVNRLFYFSLALHFILTAALFYYQFSLPTIFYLFIPGIITAIVYGYAKTHFSDYLYYFFLDGLMALSAVFTSILIN